MSYEDRLTENDASVRCDIMSREAQGRLVIHPIISQ